VLRFLDRDRELGRLRRAWAGAASFVVLYGRRRLGKSRLVREALDGRDHVFYVADARDAALQRRSFAAAVAERIPGFADVEYPDFDALTRRLWAESARGLVVAIDELPELVARSPELPTVLQKRIDEPGGPHLVVAGSSQRMMHGLVLDASAPLYGRASEIVRLEPLPAAWLGDALRLRSEADVVDHHAAWGGVPRYWELSAALDGLPLALRELVLDPLGPLHGEPTRLLLDEVADETRPASILALVGQGCHRISEIAARLGVPATDLSRPLAMLVELQLLVREIPFGESPRSTKRGRYRIADPLLRTWYRFVEPNRSRLGAGLLDRVSEEVERAWPEHVGPHWEALARQAVPHVKILGRRWDVAGRWWGRAGGPSEIDIIAESVDRKRVLVGEAKRSCSTRELDGLLATLQRKAAACPAVGGRPVDAAVFVLRKKGRLSSPAVVDAATVIGALR
jgi:AAA+ ATPase superfamily predicted ATPase